jgi:hypothetical protein
MLIHVYRIESRPVPLAGMGPRISKPIGIVQLIGGDEGRSERQREDAAIDYLMRYSPLVDDPAYGDTTWHAELTYIDTDSLGTPSSENAADGYRIWLDRP